MSWLSELLQKANWGEFEGERRALRSWEHFPIFDQAVYNLKREALFIQSADSTTGNCR